MEYIYNASVTQSKDNNEMLDMNCPEGGEDNRETEQEREKDGSVIIIANR